MSLELFIAWRYLRAQRKGLFAALTTAIGVLGVAVGIAALITTLSVMNGFQSDIEKKIIGAQAHITLYGLRGAKSLTQTEALVRADPDVAALAPFALGQAILTISERSVGIVLKGLDPAQEFQVNDLAKTLRQGRWEDLSPSKASPLPGIVLGEELTRSIGAWVGDEIVLISPKSVASPLGMLPKMQKFRVAGLLHTGYYEYDSTMAYTGLEAATKFLGIPAGATGLGVRLKNLDRAAVAARRLQQNLGPAYNVRTYAQMNQTLFAALKLEKGVMSLLLALIILVASLNIASTLILRSVEKTRDVGILKAMGAPPALIRRIFLAEGFMIGLGGLVGGLVLGLTLCWVIGHYPIIRLPADIYYISEVPVDVRLIDVLCVLVMGFLLSLLATIYPAARAAKINPVEAIRYG